MQSDELLQQWKQAKETCRKIIDISIQANIFKKASLKQSSQQFMKVYDIVYRLCSNRETEESRVSMVYRDYMEMLKGALLTMAKELLHERDIYRLKMLRNIFDAYEDIMKRLKHMFAYLNRPFYQKESKIQDLDKTGLAIIVSTLFNEEQVTEYDSIYFKCLAKIRKTKDLTDSPILKQYIEILHRFHMRLSKKEEKKVRTLYSDFQQQYLANAKQYYLHFYNKLQELSPSEYFAEVNNLYEAQRQIAEECFGTSSDSFINRIFASQFMEQYRDKLLEGSKGLRYILQNKQVDSIAVISTLYKKLTGSVDGFKEPFQNFVYEEIAGLLIEVRAELLLKKSAPIYLAFIQKLIKKKNELEEILHSSFHDYGEFINYYKAGVERAIVKNELQTPVEEMLAVYVDHKLRVSYSNEESMREDIRHIKNIFECLENKDMFLMKYLQKISKRIMILDNRAIENHKQLIFFLKKHSGSQMTEKLEGLIDEFKVSMQDDKEFRQVQEANKLPYNMTLRIFSEAIWPFPDLIDYRIEALPEVFQHGCRCMKIFEQDKIKKKTLKLSFQHSKFQWMYHFEPEVQNKFPEAYFTTNGVQAVLLFYIYQHRPERISLDLLCKVFPQFKPAHIKQSLVKMTDMAENILTRSEEQEETYYEFNRLMKSKKRIIAYDALLDDQEQEEQLFQKTEISKEREFTIDANIAKLMKSKKVLGLNQIIDEVIKMIRVFTPAVRDIKSSVERLLTKDILARDDKDKNLLKYKD